MRRKTRSPARGEPSASPATPALSGHGTATDDDATVDVDQHDVIDARDAVDQPDDVHGTTANVPTAPQTASATPDDDEARKRRRIDRFTPSIQPETATGAAAATAARIAAGRAHDWSAQNPPAGDVVGSTRTRQARRQQAGAESAEGTPKRPPARSAEEPTVAAAAGVFLATGSRGNADRQPGEKNGSALNIAPIPPHALLDNPGGTTPTVAIGWLHLATRDAALLMIPSPAGPVAGGGGQASSY